MENRKDKQLGALGLCAVTIVYSMFIPQMGWKIVLPVTMGNLLIVTFGKSIRTVKTTGTAKALSVPLFLWNILMLSIMARELSSVHMVDTPLPGLLLLLLAAYSVKRKVLTVVGAVLMFFIVGIYGTLYIFALPNVDMTKRAVESGKELTAIAYSLFPILFIYMYRGEKKRQKFVWALGAAVMALGAAIITTGMNAPNFYIASMSVNVLGTMERLEPFVASAITMGGFCLVGVLFRVNEIIWDEMWEIKKNFPLKIILLLSGGGVILSGRVDRKLLALGTTVCWGIVPIITQLIVQRKKDEKKSKNFKKMLDKWEDIC